MKPLLLAALILSIAACAAPRATAVGESDLAKERPAETARASSGLFSTIGEKLSDHVDESLAGMSFTIRSLSRRIGEDRTRFEDFVK